MQMQKMILDERLFIIFMIDKHIKYNGNSQENIMEFDTEPEERKESNKRAEQKANKTIQLTIVFYEVILLQREQGRFEQYE